MSNYYNIQNFQTFVARHGNWDIHCNQQGECAAIAKAPGCKSTHFGDLSFVERALKIEIPDNLLQENNHGG